MTRSLKVSDNVAKFLEDLKKELDLPTLGSAVQVTISVYTQCKDRQMLKFTAGTATVVHPSSIFREGET